METTDLLNMTRPGDLLLYSGDGFYSRLIRTKTWSDVSHTEVFVGGEQAVASRDKLGVGTYPVRIDGLKYVLRPNKPFDLHAAMNHHILEWVGLEYDWIGLLSFVNKNTAREGAMWCSEHTTCFYRQGGFEPFTRLIRPYKVAPGNFLYSGAFDVVYADAAHK